ncbi:hypothetical protein ABS207_19920, partial [Acinetobacter baumannii]|uniref:hypothetical protein n=1 Tax=Acinetobacter baumannii TaxID=470 RepID=UPI0033228FFE
PQRAFGASATACHMFHRLLFPLLRFAVLVVFERFRILQRLLQRVGRVEMQFRFLVDLPSQAERALLLWRRIRCLFLSFLVS